MWDLRAASGAIQDTLLSDDASTLGEFPRVENRLLLSSTIASQEAACGFLNPPNPRTDLDSVTLSLAKFFISHMGIRVPHWFYNSFETKGNKTPNIAFDT